MSILVACIGNIFQGDDAFGCEVAKVLAGRLGSQEFAWLISESAGWI